MNRAQILCAVLNRSHSDSVHMGRVDDCFRLTGQNCPLLGPAGAQLCSGGGHNFAWHR